MIKLILSFCSFFYIEDSIQAQIEELGKIEWLRNIEDAKDLANNQDKPILILFQEIPGCSTCKNFGKQVLSHPLIVETIEEYFVPVCIYNNKSGKDKDALASFNEPAWNYPVIRIFDSKMKQIAKRLNGNYNILALISTIESAFIQQNIAIPQYLILLKEESYAQQVGVKKLIIGMNCFWFGEKTYGKLPGVVNTDAVYIDGSEAVEITYNPNQITETDIINYGKLYNCVNRKYTERDFKQPTRLNPEISFAKDIESKYYLYHSDWAYIPMTNYQATLANSLLGERKDCSNLFSKKQLGWYSDIRQEKNVKKDFKFHLDILMSWYSMVDFCSPIIPNTK